MAQASLRSVAVLVLCVLAGCSQARALEPAAAPASRAPAVGKAQAVLQPGFAVVELFTSEGCSSCPQADVVLGKLARDAAAQGTQVFTLGFHVDYWDSAAWRDRYSAHWASHRQQTYAAAFGRDRVYTPQMIVNGHDEFVGSRESQAKSLVAQALQQHPLLSLQLTAAAPKDGHVELRYALAALPASRAVLNLALVQRGAKDHIRGGENDGLELEHVSIVRDFDVLHLEQKSGNATLTLPEGLSAAQLAELSVVAYVQDTSSGAMLGATRAALNASAH